MTNLINLLLQKKQFVLYCIIGVSGMSLDTGLYSLLVTPGLLAKSALLDPKMANAISYSCGTLLSFFLNARFNFRVTDKMAQRMATFFGVAALGWLVSTAMLYELIDVHHFNKYGAKIATIPVIVLIQFNLNRLISFRKAS